MGGIRVPEIQPGEEPIMEDLMDRISAVMTQMTELDEAMGKASEPFQQQLLAEQQRHQDETHWIRTKEHEALGEMPGQRKMLEEDLTRLKEQLRDRWSHEKKALAKGSLVFQLSTRRKPEVLNPQALMTASATMARPPIRSWSKMPWDNKRLVTLVDEGIIPARLVKVNDEKSLVVKVPKKPEPEEKGSQEES